MRVLQAAYEKQHEAGGKPPDLTVSDKLLITLQYYREYRTMEHIGIDYGCSKSSVSRSVRWVEQTLSADGQFQLPGKQALQDGTPKTVAVDVTEHPIHRPNNNAYSNQTTLCVVQDEFADLGSVFDGVDLGGQWLSGH